MSQRTLYLRLTDKDGPVEWLLVTADNSRKMGSSALSELPNDMQGAQLIVLVPATAVTLASVSLPPVKRSQQRQAALFALEDQLIDDIGDLHAALGERSKEGRLPLAVTSCAQLEEWLAQLQAHHLRPDKVVVDVLMLPWAENEWSLLWEDESVRVRTSSAYGIGLEVEQWPVVWPRLLAEVGEQRPARLRVFDARTTTSDPLPLDDALPGGEVEVIANAGGMRWLASEPSAASLNLLQGDYSRREQWGRRLRPWLPAAVLLLAWVVIQAGMAMFELHTLRQQVAQLDTEMEALYLKSFPDARKVVNPRLQMEQKLSALKNGDSGFMTLMASVAPAIKSAQVKGVRFQEGALDIDLSVPDMAALDAVRAALESKKLQVAIGNAAQQDGKVESRVTVRGGGE